jgi:O-acetyl-ADP-ribose deacetylase (regulator of RNase III)
MKAILRMAKAHAEIGRAIFCPGLCTGVGGVDPSEAGEQMARAYHAWQRK